MAITEQQIVDHRINEDPVSRQRKAIESQAHAELRNSAYPPVRRVSCDYHEGVLTMRGRVPSYFLKQIAQTVILHRLESVVVINNRVEVVTQSDMTSAQLLVEAGHITIVPDKEERNACSQPQKEPAGRHCR